MHTQRIEDTLAFIRAADTRSFTVAAEQLGLSRSTVGKRITRLEARLGVRLLQRTTRSVTLTDEGMVFYAHCVGILHSLEAAEASMAAHATVPAGWRRIDVPVSLGRLQILPVVHAYLRQWPMVDVRISFNDRYVDLIEEGIDVAVRVGGLADSGLISQTVAPHRLVTCAAPDYLRRRGVPASVDDLAKHNCLAFEHGGRTAQWHFLVDGVRRRVRIDGNLVVTQAEALRDATTAGLGIGQLATFLISDELCTGRLVPVLERHEIEGEPLSVIYPVRTLLPPCVKAFVDLLIQCWQPVPP